MKATLILSTIAGVAVAGTRPPPGCAFDNCFWKEKIPSEWRPVAKTFCEALVGKQPCNTKTVTTTQTLPPTTLIRTKPPTTIRQTTRSTTTVYDSIVETVSQIDGTSCIATGSAVSATTEITFPTNTPASRVKERAFENIEDDLEYQSLTKRTNLPSFVSAGCNKSPPLDKLKAACKCFLQAPPPVVTVTKKVPGPTITSTLPPTTKTLLTTLAPLTTTRTTTNTITATLQTCTSTSTLLPALTLSNCGAPPATYTTASTGQISCTQPASLPSPSINAFHRIEASDTEGTLFEGCIVAGPRSLDTPSGGSHPCGVTGTSISAQMDAAAQLNGFTYDGTYASEFNDYFITRIGATSQTNTQFWGVLQNGGFTTVGGCQAEVQPGDTSLWLYDAFSLQGGLEIEPAWAVARVGSTVEIKVLSRDLNGGAAVPFSGATLSGTGAVSGSDGGVEVVAPEVPGCYVYKARAGGRGRSNAFYLNVVGGFPAVVV